MLIFSSRAIDIYRVLTSLISIYYIHIHISKYYVFHYNNALKQEKNK